MTAGGQDPEPAFRRVHLLDHHLHTDRAHLEAKTGETTLKKSTSPEEEEGGSQATWLTLSWLSWAAKAFSMSASKASIHIYGRTHGERSAVGKMWQSETFQCSFKDTDLVATILYLIFNMTSKYFYKYVNMFLYIPLSKKNISQHYDPQGSRQCLYGFALYRLLLPAA